MLTVSTSGEQLFEAIKSGASGYLLKTAGAEQFLEMIGQVGARRRRAAAGPGGPAARRVRPPGAPRETSPESLPEDLAPRQIEILTLVAQGSTYAQVGEALCLAEATVRYHMAQIMDRLHLENRAQVIAYAARHGLGRSIPKNLSE